jgi:ubiquinone/menaquinone biosynthesis C-methylase UbiE
MTYDAHRTRVFFDTFGRREWDRLELTVQGRVKYAVHKRLLEEYITPGMRVLDIGSGPGRFAIDIVNLGARVTVADLSPVQLNLAREHMRDLQHGVDGFHVLDATDLSSVPSAEFDAVVCYGGVLSYTRERHPIALRELHRVTRPGGVVLASVMDVFGTLRLVGPLDAANVLETMADHLDINTLPSGLVYTMLGSPEMHQPIVLFTANGLRSAMHDAGLDVIDMATSNPLVPEYSAMPRITGSERATSALTALEVALCKEPSLLGAGGHLIAVARRAD